MSVARMLMIGALVGTVAAGCMSTHPLPTVGSDGSACRGVGLDGVLRGSQSDARVAWVESHFLGQQRRVEVVFPRGFGARFTPNLEILDGAGHVVAKDGDPITGGCTTGPDAQGPVLILGVGSVDIRRQ